MLPAVTLPVYVVRKLATLVLLYVPGWMGKFVSRLPSPMKKFAVVLPTTVNTLPENVKLLVPKKLPPPALS